MTWTVSRAAEDENWDNGTPAGPTINEDWNGGGPSGGDNFESGFESNVSKHAYDTEAKPDGDDRACNNCGETGHLARECPQPKKMTGECYNCGEVGHNKADCTNPTVDRPFTGTCRTCNKEGHRSADCPDKAPSICRNCQKEGHYTSDCKENRAMGAFFEGVPDVDLESAWDMVVKADQERDLDDFRTAIKAYARGYASEFAELELALRNIDANIYIIGLEREISDTMTIVDLQGRIDRQYVVGFYFSPKPRNMKAAERWPSSKEDNLERLKNAGFVMDRMIPKCHNCDQLGHPTKFCKEEKVEREDRVEVKCFNCNETGHRVRDCTKARVDPFTCRNCKKPGHNAKECPEPRSAEGVECKRCNEMGHFAKDCPNSEPQSRGCRNCGEEGHIAKDCDKPRNPETVTCRNCDEKGHFSKECPKPRDYSRVKCSNCGEMGHTIRRCPTAPAESNGGGGGGGRGASGEEARGGSNGAKESNNGGGPDAAAGAWNDDTPTAADTAAGEWSSNVPASSINLGW